MRPFVIVFLCYLGFGMIAQAHALGSPNQPKGLKPPAVEDIVCPSWEDTCCLVTEEGPYCAVPQVLPYFIRTAVNTPEEQCNGPLCYSEGQILGVSPFYPFYPPME